MCGITGIWDFTDKIEPPLLEAMHRSLAHRGPDDQGAFIDEAHNVGLGHRRLSILDLTAKGRQPMHFDGLCIVHNGEIYNFKDIRGELQKKGYSFESDTDTEVILKSYREWGIQCVERFRGMFAFCIWDATTGKLVLVRDRAGIKPLYYYFDGERFIFASELKAILVHPKVTRDLNYDALALYFKFGYIPAPLSIIRNVSKLESGSILSLAVDHNIQISQYWSVVDLFDATSGAAAFGGSRENAFPQDLPEEEAADALEEILTESFRLRLVSDVPVGVFLSGGIDSPTVAALLQKETTLPVQTFSIGFTEQELNEAEDAKRIAAHLGTDHKELYCTARMAMDILPKIPEIFDEPFGDSSAIPTYLVASFARSHVKVALSADGADEIFQGYRHHARHLRLHQIFSKHRTASRLIANALKWSPMRNLASLAIPNLDIRATKLDDLTRKNQSWSRFYFNSLREWSDTEIAQLLGRQTEGFDSFLKLHEASENCFSDFSSFMRATDYKRFLPDDILVKVDRTTMAVGLEGRDPFLDHKIIEFASKLPQHLIVKDGVSKYLLRKVLHRYVPESLVDRPKQGFSIPLRKWLRNDLSYLVHDYLSEDRIRREGILDWKTIEAEKRAFFDGRSTTPLRLWLLIEFEMWQDKWIR
ncbi:MAG: asparagine synthase (glutamine-hydrolyzing) [Candidatus Latescibacterota bacterium]